MKLKLYGVNDEAGFIEKDSFDPKNCSVWITVNIGPENENWSENFSINVVTIEFLHTDQKQPTWGKSKMIVPFFSWSDIENTISCLLGNISTNNWDDAVKILVRYMNWEYEGMENTSGMILVPYVQ